MTPAEICQLLEAEFGGAILKALPEDKHPRVHLRVDDWRKVAEFLRKDKRLEMDWLANLSGVDYAAGGEFCVVYDLWSFGLGHRFAVKVYAPRGEGVSYPTVSDLWRAAEWHEREVFDLFGIGFAGHGDLRRILLADDWVGYPLRKDYVFPKEYHGIPAHLEPEWDDNA